MLSGGLDRFGLWWRGGTRVARVTGVTGRGKPIDSRKCWHAAAKTAQPSVANHPSRLSWRCALMVGSRAACPGHMQAPSRLDRLLVWHLLTAATARMGVSRDLLSTD